MMGESIFTKEERIKSKKVIDFLFSGGAQSFSAFPIRVVYREHPIKDKKETSILISVSKKRFKNAVDRNKIKRLLRETYRLNKKTLLERLTQRDKKLAIAFIYLSKDIYSFEKINQQMSKLLKLISEDLDQPNA